MILTMNLPQFLCFLILSFGAGVLIGMFIDFESNWKKMDDKDKELDRGMSRKGYKEKRTESICDNCATRNCVFDSNTKRNKCDFYKPKNDESEG